MAEIFGCPANIQLELVELQNHDGLNNFLDIKLSSKAEKFPEDFSYLWKLVPRAEFPAITDQALHFLSSFESTYIYEKVCSDVIHVKNEYRSSSTQQHI